MIGGDPLQSADRDRLVLDTTATARRLARPIAHAPQDAGEHVGLAVQEIRVVESALRDQTNVLWDVGVSRARPLTIDHVVKVLGTRSIRGFHLVASDRNPLD
jgi:hypothetical protein